MDVGQTVRHDRGEQTVTNLDIEPSYMCDRCHVSRAAYLIKLINGELSLCGHHYNRHKEMLDKNSYEVIELNKVEEALKLTEKAV